MHRCSSIARLFLSRGDLTFLLVIGVKGEKIIAQRKVLIVRIAIALLVVMVMMIVLPVVDAKRVDIV